MGKIRVLIASHPRLMRDLVLATILDQPDMEIVGEAADPTELVRAAAECKPDFVVVFTEKFEGPPPICSELLAHNPQARVLALAPERNQGAFFWAETDIRSIAVESSEQGILDTLRGQRAVCNWRSALN